VLVVTVSTDRPEVILERRGVHGLQAHMLSDRDLVVTDAFGLRNQGIDSAPPGDGMEALPVPTSLLIDAEGKVLWKGHTSPGRIPRVPIAGRRL
jgi:peroxiredoxin